MTTIGALMATIVVTEKAGIQRLRFKIFFIEVMQYFFHRSHAIVKFSIKKSTLVRQRPTD